MKQAIIIFFIIAIGTALYKQCTKPPTYTSNTPYVSVYGRTSCGNTRRIINYLDSQKIPYNYFSIDETTHARYIHTRMHDAGINTRNYYLPVVDVNGQISTNPRPDSVRSAYYSGSR